MFLILLITFALFVYNYEKKSLGFGLFSPINLFMLPTLILILFSYIEEKYVGYLSASQGAIAINLYGFVLFWLGGLFYLKLSQSKIKRYISMSFNSERIDAKPINVIALLCLGILLLNLNNILGNRSFLQLEDQEFAQNGIAGHVGEWIVFFIIYYLASIWDEKLGVRNKWFALFWVIIFLGFKIIMSVKAQAVIPFVTALIYMTMNGYIKITIKSLVISFCLIFALFSLPAILFNTDDHSFEYILSYFFFYLYAGISGLSSYLATYPGRAIGDCPEFMIRFFQNLFSKFFGRGEIMKGGVAPGYVEVFTDNAMVNHSSNVCTMIGEIYLNAGAFLGGLYFFAIGMCSYFIFLRSKENQIYTIIYSYLGAILAMNFFSSYILGQTFYELMFFSFVMYILLRKTKSIHSAYE